MFLSQRRWLPQPGRGRPQEDNSRDCDMSEFDPQFEPFRLDFLLRQHPSVACMNGMVVFASEGGEVQAQVDGIARSTNPVPSYARCLPFEGRDRLVPGWKALDRVA